MIITRITDYATFLDFFNKSEDEKNSTRDKKSVLLYFTGSDDPETQKSWCPDCVVSKPVITEAIEKYRDNERISLAIVEVGQRSEWKQVDNPYRTHSVKVTSVPTLLSMNTGNRVTQCSDADKVLEMFSSESGQK